MEFCVSLIIMLLFVASSIREVHSSTPSNDTNNNGGFVLPLYHRMHPKYRRGTNNTTSLNDSNVVAHIDNPFKYAYVAEFDIGTPPVRVEAVVDTGSSFTWFSPRIFNPSKSTSFVKLHCEDKRCNYGVGTDCSSDGKNWCIYYARYEGGKTSTGNVGQEVLYFNNDVAKDTQTSVVLVIGAQDMVITPEPTKLEPNYQPGDVLPGILGLGYDFGGLLGMLKVDIFSICLPLHYPSSSYVRFGDKAALLGPYTKLKLKANHYYFEIEAIVVVSQPITLHTDRDSTSMFIFDTGSSVTSLHPKIFDLVKEAMQKEIGSPGVGDPRGVFEFCYEERELEKIKHYTRTFRLYFKFFNDKDWFDLGFARTWTHIAPNHWCFAFLRSKTNRSIFGSWQMRGFNFGLKPKSERLYFYPDTNCNGT